MLKSQIIRSVPIMVLVGLGGCGTDDPSRSRTISGLDIGRKEWTIITDNESIVYFVDPPNVLRIQANKGPINRYQERINFWNEAYVFYEHLYVFGLRTLEGVEEIFYQLMKRNDLLQRRGVSIERKDVKTKKINGIEYAYSVLTGGIPGFLQTCFAFYAFFGNQTSSSEGDKGIHGVDCGVRDTPEELEKEWFSLLERIRFDGPKPGWTSN